MRTSAVFAISVAAAALLGNLSRAANVTILNGSIDLSVSTATAGSEPDTDTDQSAQLQWDNWPNSATTKKITVQTNLASPNFALSVLAVNIDRKSTRLNSSHDKNAYAVVC